MNGIEGDSRISITFRCCDYRQTWKWSEVGNTMVLFIFFIFHIVVNIIGAFECIRRIDVPDTLLVKWCDGCLPWTWFIVYFWIMFHSTTESKCCAVLFCWENYTERMHSKLEESMLEIRGKRKMNTLLYSTVQKSPSTTNECTEHVYTTWL